ncbi:MAG: sporulation protein YabP [Clostridiales bacterium]|nr:sporulation protein YabP [Clostridiales bacterium]
MEEKLTQNGNSHKIIMTNRNMISLTGVNDVMSFDANEILLDTVQGMLLLRGEELHVNRLSLERGEVDVDGKVDSLAYAEENTYLKNGESLWRRLFK